MEIVKLALVFIVILSLLKFKLNVGSSIFVGGLALGFLFGQNPLEVGKSVLHGVVSWPTLRLILVVSIISSLGTLLKYLDINHKMVRGIRNLSGSVKASMVLCPALIGLMPMPGGALLSAPLVEEASEGENIAPHKLTAINYWFRHILEFCWPIYPGIILASAILKIEVSDIALWQSPFSIAFILGGLIFLIFPMRGVSHIPRLQSKMQSWKDILYGLWPILLVVVITVGAGLDILYSLIISSVLFLVLNRPKISTALKSVKEGASFSIISLMLGVMVFQSIIADSGAAVELSTAIKSWGVPDWLVVSLSCFLIGILAGIVTAYVGIVYPILIAILINPEPDMAMIVLAYGSGLIGVMISPIHLCLILTIEYFKTSFSKVYPLILGPAAFVTAALIIGLVLGYGSS